MIKALINQKTHRNKSNMLKNVFLVYVIMCYCWLIENNYLILQKLS